MFVTLGLEHLINEIDEVVPLTGNVGKQVRRTLEKLFDPGSTEARIQVMLENSAWSSKLIFAYAVDRVRNLAELANTALKDCYDRDDVRFSVEAKSFFDLDIVVSVSSGIPEGMKARQALLDAIGFGLRRFMAFGTLRRLPSTEAELLQSIFEDTIEGIDVPALVKSFKDLVDGRLDQIDSVPICLICLAGVLNPAVHDRLPGAE